MKVICKALNPEILNLELTVSMNIAQWKSVSDCINGGTRWNSHAEDLQNAIRDAIAEYTDRVELERSIRTE